MRQAIFVCPLLLTIQLVHGQKSIPSAEASKHVGEKTTVCDKVFGGKYLENAKGQPTLVNMGAAYPDNPFTFVIFADDRKKFTYKPEEFLISKQVCVTGEIVNFKDKPQIIVTDTTQLTIK